jgi:Tfp pilus assembly protein PilX
MIDFSHKFTGKGPRSERGAALLTFVIFFLLASTLLVLGIGRSVYQSLAETRVLHESKRSFYAAEAAVEDAIYRQRDSRAYSSTETFTIDGSSVTVNRVLNIDIYEFTATANTNGAVRRSFVELAVGDGASFNFGLQSGNGGITLSNNSSVYGNVFSNGTVEGQGSATVFGDIVSAGTTGLIDSITATGSAYSHSITASTIGGNAYYYATGTLTGTIVSGVKFPGYPDQATATMPIPDSMIESWKDQITASGTVISATSTECLSGTYVIDSNTTLNNVRIDCNVDMRKQGASTDITIAGPVWIRGNLSFSQGPNIIASSSLGSRSVQIIVDTETSRATSSKIAINQSTNFTSGNALSYVILISMNNDAEIGGSTVAVDLAQSANGKVLLYAPHGRVAMGNSITLREVTGYQIDVNNGANIIYESGLASLLFTGGPGGGYTIGRWNEI